MFERFTDRGRQVVVLAQEEARMVNHNYIGTEHILLGLIREGEGVAAIVLESLGITLEAVRQQVEEIIGYGQLAPSGRIPFTPRAKKVLELSLREALQLGHNHIGTEHLLLGLIREGEGVAAQVLVKLGANLNAVRERVLEVLGADSGGGPAVVGRAPVEWLERVVVVQMRAYNKHDPDTLAACYAADARIIDGDGAVVAAGREAIRARYAALFAASPTVQATCLQRMVVGRHVVEHELAQGVAGPGAGTVHALVLYTIAEGRIAEARFLT